MLRTIYKVRFNSTISKDSMIKNSIPFVDLRGKSPIDLLRAYPDKASDIIKAASRTYGLASHIASIVALPIADKKSLAWLKNNRNPYLYEIESFSEIMDKPGIISLNLSYEWACTSGTYRTDETVSLLRVLDWPYPSLGKHLVIALQKGKAGDFYNVTWPALSGVFTGLASGRFAAAINQAPMRAHQLSHFGDWFRNRMIASHETGLPPSHLLRQVFENAANYQDAKRLLSETRIAVPAIFTLSGINQGEGCIIERLEDSAQVIELSASQQVTASNHFNSSLANVGKGWRPRQIDSIGRYKQSCDIHGYDIAAEHFDWLRAPIRNQYTRLCCVANAATNRLMVQGFEGMMEVTSIFTMQAETNEQREAV